MLLLDREFSDTQLHALSSEADLRNIGKNVWPRVLSHCRADELRLYHITLPSLDGIERLTSTRKLNLEWATKIDEVSPVFRMTNLTSLSIFDFPKLKNLSGIEALTKLLEFQLSGSRGATTPALRLTSIKPVVELPNLVSFSLQNAKIDDDDVTCLADCKTLRSLILSNQFEKGQIAYLAKRLNSQLEKPLSSRFESSSFCASCGKPKHMFVGRKMPILCSGCDAARFQKLDEEFDRLVQQA